MNGVLVIDKPAGITSHDVVASIKKLTDSKTGHAGTLDPFATGVLIILLGQATKISRFLLNDDKTYEGRAIFGLATETGDITGDNLFKSDPSAVDQKSLTKVFKAFTGEIMQTPHTYSAVKVGGKKGYELARKGKEFSPEERKVTVYDLKLKRFIEGYNPRADFEVKVSKGTYIRTLFEDIAASLGTGAFLESLRRISSGKFAIADSVTLDELKEDPLSIKKHLISVREALAFPEIKVNDDSLRLLLNGAPLTDEMVSKGKIPENGEVAVIDRNGKILSVQKIGKGKAKVLTVFNDDSD